MREFIITDAQAGQKAIKYCQKVLPQSQPSFLHKMMRKKNITRNGKKVEAYSWIKSVLCCNVHGLSSLNIIYLSNNHRHTTQCF